jgi:hypothetical protein
MKAIELPAFGTVGDRLGAGMKVDRGGTAMFFFGGHFFFDRRVVQKYRVFFLCANCAILVVFIELC